MISSTLCTLLYLLNAEVIASDLLKDLDRAFPASELIQSNDTPAKGVLWHLPSLWRKANVQDGETLIDPINNDTTLFSKFGERLSNWQRRIWAPLPHKDEPDEEEPTEMTEPSSWLDRFVRKRVPANNTQSVAEDNQIIGAQADEPEPHTPETEAPPPSSGASGVDDDKWKASMPDSNLMEGLRCVPIVSFTACLNHCFAVLPAAAEVGEDLTSALLPPPRESRKWFDTEAFYTNLWGSRVEEAEDDEDIESDARKASRKNHNKDVSSPRVLDWAQKEQLKLCLFSVCARDYLKTALPGCIDPSGLLVNPSSRVNRTDSTPDSGSYEELNFYNPHKLSFYADLGYFTFSRLWSNFFPDGAISGWLMIPVWVICLLIMPILIITWANPMASAHSPAAGRRDLPPNVHLCDDLFVRHPTWRWVQKTIHTLGNCAELLITFGYSLGFFISGLLAGSAVHRLLPAQALSANSVEMTSARSAIKRPDGYHSLAQQDRV